MTTDLSLRPHHDGSALYVETDRPDVGDVVSVWLRVPHGHRLDGAWVRSTPDAEATYVPAVIDRRDDHADWWRAELLIRNPVTRYRWLLDGPDRAYGWVNGTGVVDHDIPDAHDFTLSAHPAPPSWAADAIVYQIFPDRFARSAAADSRPVPSWAEPSGWADVVRYRGPGAGRQLFGGDLDGVTAQLDYIQDLGFDTVYLTPFFPARSVHRYDASTFDQVDPLLGGDAALARLSAAIHERGMRIIGDLTTNHTGAGHDWFATAQADTASPERAFYYFEADDSYETWNNFASLPKLRFGPELQRRMLAGPDSVVGRWLRPPYALDGWRIDVANMTARRLWEDGNREVARAIRATMAALAPAGLLIAEHCYDASADLSGEGWHGAMNYAGFLRPVWSWVCSPDYPGRFLEQPVGVPRLGAQQMVAGMRASQAVVPWRSLVTSWSLLGSHDTPRIRTVVGDAAVQAMAAGLLFTGPGAPMVFMGDELGGEGVKGEDARRPMPWQSRDQWDLGTLEVYRALARLRRDHRALHHGGMRWVHAHEDVAVYLRESPEETLLCLASRSGQGRTVALPARGLGLDHRGCARNVYGGAADLRPGEGAAPDQVLLDVDGPQFQVWLIDEAGTAG